MANATPEENARLGGQMGALKAVDISENDRPSGAQSRSPSATRTKVVPLYQRTYVRPGRLLAPPVPAVRHVMLSITGAAVIFFVAGGRFGDVINRVRGQPKEAEAPEIVGEVFTTLVGWGALLFILVFMADTGVMAPLAIGFSWLIFFMVLLEFGAKASENVLNLMGGNKEEPATTAIVPPASPKLPAEELI